MFLVCSKHYKKIYIIFFLFLLNNCQLREPSKAHGINFLQNREQALTVNKTNKNDVIALIGNPHSISLADEDTWIYFERTITKGKLIKLGQNVLKVNNVLELEFNKYGILKNKKLINKEDMKKVSYSTKKTENEISQPSFMRKFLGSVRQKMYGKKKF
jgi:outer membrane protein assembly factor BamE (lipoprotein component of BamABCDE complex)